MAGAIFVDATARPHAARTDVVLHNIRDEDPYVNSIRAHPPESFDLVLIDGLYRRACVYAAVPYVKPGGLLVVDNTDFHWTREDPIQGVPDNWQRTVYAGYAPMLGHGSETTVWVRPPA